jgi:bifunctional non-homologous end joining protein LigD
MTAMPNLIRPMLATPGSLPAADDSFGYETKWDGVRAIAYVCDGRLRLFTRNDADVTAAYTELAGLGATLERVNAILDGEIVALDKAGRVSFSALQPRMHLRDARQIARLVEQTPVSYRIFDLLHLDGNSTMDLPYQQRREVLDGLPLVGARWAITPYTVGGGAAALAKAAAERTEGIVAKRLDSRYLPGKRTPAWLKIKNFRTQEVVVGGWRGGQGARSGTIGSLLLGIPGPAGLEYVGQVGTGFTRDTLEQLQALLTARSRGTSPFVSTVPRREAKDAHWVSPRLVGEVAFAEWTRDDRLRHPSWRGLRPDKTPEEVVREST